MFKKKKKNRGVVFVNGLCGGGGYMPDMTDE